VNSKDIAIVSVFAIVALLAAANLLRPVMRAWACRLEGGVVDPGLSNEVADLRERVAELEGTGARLAELEERLDFAERMLANRPADAQLPVHRTPA
jgi:hypothetical protein